MKLSSTLSEETIKTMEMFNDDIVRRVDEDLHPIAPDLVEKLIKAVYEDAYQRNVLTLRERHIATLSALIAMGGAERQLSFQGLAAYKIGLTREDIQEILIQNSVFSGFTRAMNASVVLDEARKKFEQGQESEA